MKEFFSKYITNKNLFYLFCILVFIIACYLRLSLYFFADGIHMDEAKLSLNVIENSYFELFMPLLGHQVSPPVFLVLSKIIYSLFHGLNSTITYSDLLFRVVPLFAGIFAIPSFGYLLHKLFKNNITTISGMFILAINPAHIVYSTVFKQYSFECLITILIFILFLKIDFNKKSLKYNIFLFSLLGISLFCSMTAQFIIPCGFIYLLSKVKDKKDFKKYIICTIVFLFLFSIYLIGYLIPVYNAHYIINSKEFGLKYIDNFDFRNFFVFLDNYMCLMFRTSDFHFSLCVIFFISLINMICKKHYIVLYLSISILITHIFIYTQHYPFEERLLLFLLPFIIIFLVYLIDVIPQKYFYKWNIVYIVLLFVIFYGVMHVYPKRYINYMVFETKPVWNYFLKHYENDGRLILCPLDSGTIYYNYLTKKLDFGDCKKSFENAPAGTYYLIGLKYQFYKQYIDGITEKNCKIQEKIIFHGRYAYALPDYQKARLTRTPDGFYIKLIKTK